MKKLTYNVVNNWDRVTEIKIEIFFNKNGYSFKMLEDGVKVQFDKEYRGTLQEYIDVCKEYNRKYTVEEI